MSEFPFKKYAILSLIAFAFSSCKKDDDKTVLTENYKGYFVINEGAYGKSNGSIGLFKPGDKSYFDAFNTSNSRPLGDVVQSMTLIDEKFYVCVNNSNKIEILNQDNFKSIKTIQTISPRYVLMVGTNIAYVTNLFSNSVKILNTITNTFDSSINIHHNSDRLTLMDGKVYISTFDNIIMVVDAKTNVLIDSIITGKGLSQVVNAGSSQIGVLCSGVVDWNNGNVLEKGKIQLISKDSTIIEQTFELSTGSYGGSMVYSDLTKNFYFSLGNSKVNKMSMTGVITDFITLDAGQSVYGLNINTNTGELFISDAGDFNSSGKVYVYNLNGVKLFEFSCGIAPNGIFFNNL